MYGKQLCTESAYLNPITLRKAKIVCNFDLSECKYILVNVSIFSFQLLIERSAEQLEKKLYKGWRYVQFFVTFLRKPKKEQAILDIPVNLLDFIWLSSLKKK